MTARRDALRMLSGLSAFAVLPLAAQAPAVLPKEVRELLGNAKPREQGIALIVPDLAETGQSVPVRIEVDSAMSGNDRVNAVYLIAPLNPRPRIADFFFGPAAPRAVIATRIRMGASQELYAVAAMADGTFRMRRFSVVVTLAACIDGT